MEPMEKDREFYERLEAKGVSRRDFMKYCTYLTATLGLSASYTSKVAEVFASPKEARPPVIWLHFGECTGCTEGFLRSMYPWADELVLDILDIEYHETIMAAAGNQAEENLKNAVEKYNGKFVCIVEGSIPTTYPEYGMIGGRTFLEIAKDVCPKAAAVISIGSCASFGGIPAAKPNPGGYKGIGDALGIKTINLPGCPTNPVNLIGTVVNYLLLGNLPEVDNLSRPLFAYGSTIHDKCPRRSHFENGEFVTEFGSEEAKLGYCLYQMGCKGPETYNNCPTVKFQGGTSWPIQAGHPCMGCSEPNFWDTMTPFYEEA